MTITRSTFGAPVSRRTATACLCGLPIVALAALAWHSRWTFEDAFIYFRVIANLQDGLGPVWNAGERVEVYTSPLWVGILWPASSVLSFAAIEWIAFVLGLLATIGGCTAAARGSWLLWRGTGRMGVALPLGLLVVVALRPMWLFTTSGLETGLVFLWLGGCFWALASLTERRTSRLTPAWAAVAIGVGPLVRPDLGIFSIGFMVALLVMTPSERRFARLRLIAAALLLPAAYQLFRMGYFAALEPNTALAKEAGLSDWSRGWTYLTDFVDPYVLFLPLALLFVYAALELRAAPARRAPLVTGLAAVTCGLLHAAYIVRVGGDFAHARMLLPSLFGLLLPVAVVIPRWRAWPLAVGLAVIPWAALCAATLRSDTDRLGAGRGQITLQDSRDAVRARTGAALRDLAEQRRALVVRVPLTGPPLRISGAPARSSPEPVVAGALTVGMVGFASGPRVHIVDQLGITDAFGSRTELGPLRIPVRGFGIERGGPPRYRHVRARAAAGHEKYLPSEWVVARFAPDGVDRFRGVELLSPAGVAAARRALRCPPLRRLSRAVTAPLTPGRFLSNVGASFSLTALRFPADPVEAERELCGDEG